MRYYFAAAYQRKAQIADRAREIEHAGIGAVVTSRWLTGPDLTQTDAGMSAGMLLSDDAIKAAWEFGQRDLEDVASARAIVSFTGEGARGGRHVEHGYAMRLNERRPVTGFRLIVIGPREHVFHCHPATEHYDTWAAFLACEVSRHHREARL